jgi:hypothetical protein
MDKAKHMAELYGLAWALGVITLPVAKYILERFGGPVWQAVKKIAYNVWEDVKGLVSKLKFW